jgi:hypothetical protein
VINKLFEEMEILLKWNRNSFEMKWNRRNGENSEKKKIRTQSPPLHTGILHSHSLVVSSRVFVIPEDNICPWKRKPEEQQPSLPNLPKLTPGRRNRVQVGNRANFPQLHEAVVKKLKSSRTKRL